MAGVLVFDIETVPDQELLFSEGQSEPVPGLRSLPVGHEEGPPPLASMPKIPFNRVVLIGAAKLSVKAAWGTEEYRLEELDILRGSESEVLSRFWELAQGQRLVSF